VSLRAVDKRSLPDQVFEQLTAAIVAGTYPPGAAIPAERELSAMLGVNRHVVREAIKRLEQIGLVRVSQGGRTTVLDYRATAGLDLLAVVAEHAEAIAALAPLLAAALEMRAGIGADVAGLCAERADPQLGEELLAMAARLAATDGGDELLELDRSFWQLVLDGAGNVAYQLAFNSLIRAVHARRELSLPLLAQELARTDHRRPIAAAIAAGDGAAAAREARAALTPPAAGPARRARGSRARRRA
jgi:DNA-binding FadR family transcriptional regulator